MDRMGKITALAGLLVLAAGTADAQGWYNPAIFGGPDLAGTASRPSYDSVGGLYLSPDGGLYSGSVNRFSIDMGGGVSMGVITTLSHDVAGGFSGLPGNILVPGFAGTGMANYANGSYLDPAANMASSVSGRLSLDLGGGLSMNFLGGLSRAPGNGFYFGPASGFENRMSTTVGTGFSMNFGHGGTLSVIGSVSRGFGGGCGSLSIAGCR